MGAAAFAGVWVATCGDARASLLLQDQGLVPTLLAEERFEQNGARARIAGKLLAQLQCNEAIRLEGGPASEMVVDGKRRGMPPGENVPETPLGSALGLYAPR